MKRLWKPLAISCTLLACALTCAPSALAQKTQAQNTRVTERITKLDAMDNVDLMNSVKISEKFAQMVSKFQHNEAQKLMALHEFGEPNTPLYNTKEGFKIETMRKGEIIIVTIPTDRLFLPNETDLMYGADKYLEPLKRYLKVPDMYRMILVVHTDNTGSDEYLDNLSEERVDAIFEWFDDEGCHTAYIFPSFSGQSEPLVPNISGENRARNRRLEVFLVPGEEMLRQAKSGRISL